MSNFNVGDIVQLKSGGPDMTIAEIDPFDSVDNKKQVRCIWFDNKEQKQGYFVPEALQKIS